MDSDLLVSGLIASLLASLRVAPVIAFAPPFTLVRLPATFRMLLSLGIAACIVAAGGGTPAIPLEAGALAGAAARELLLGTMFMIVFQITFAALQFAGRTLDLQAGFGLAGAIDPTTRAAMPLVGTLFVYAAATVFFATDGHVELVRLFALSFESVPLGAYALPPSPDRIGAYLSLAFLTAFGIAAAPMIVLFLTDVTIALLSRTVPQMNVLILGFQVKTLLLLLVLPLSFGAAGALLLGMTRRAIEAIPGLV